MSNSFNFTLGFDVRKQGLEEAKRDINKLKEQIQKNPAKFNVELQDLPKTLGELDKVQKALEKAFNPNLGRIDTRVFQSELKKLGVSTTELRQSFQRLGVDGSAVFASLEKGARYTGLSIKKTSELVDSMANTFKNTLRWNIASQTLNRVQGSIGRAVGFVKDLDNSLNNIQVITRQSDIEMQSFARSANEAAKALGKTTKEYVDASLLFFQQGKNAEEVRYLTQATLMAANITGEATADMAELITAALNGYNLAASEALTVTDKLAAVGASTGANFAELAIGFSKVASMAKAAGVEIDQLNGMIATISTVTREAPQSIGTSLKTIFSRMTNLRAGEEDEGWQLGQVEQALNKVGISLSDAENNLRDLGEVIEEVGSKWHTFSKEDQMGVSIALAGARQQNRLMALFNSWKMYEDAVVTSLNAEGTTMEQNLVRMDSIEYKAKQLRAEMETLWSRLVDSNTIKTMLDFMNSLVQQVNRLVDAFGGLGPILTMVGASMVGIFSGHIYKGAMNMADNFNELVRNSKSAVKRIEATVDKDLRKELEGELVIRQHLTQEDQKRYKELMNQKRVAKEAAELAKAQQTTEEKKLADRIAKLKIEREITEERRKQWDKARQEIEGSRGKKGVHPSAETLALLELTPEQYQNYVNRDGKKTTLSVLEDEVKGMQLPLKKQVQALEKAQAETEKLMEVEKKRGDLWRKDLADSHEKKVKDLDDQAQALIKQAEAAKRSEMALSMLAAGTIAATGAIQAYKQYTDGAISGTEAWQSGLTAAAGALAMLPIPGARVISMAAILSIQIWRAVDANTGLNKIIKQNEQVLKDYAHSMSRLRDEMRSLSAERAAFEEVTEALASGLGPDSLPEELQQKYRSLSDTIAQTHPELIRYFDAEGNAVVDLTVAYEDLIEKKQEQMRQQNQMLVANAGNFMMEYAGIIQKGEQQVAIIEAQIHASTAKLASARDRGSMGEIRKAQEELTKLNVELSETNAKLHETRSNVNTHIVVPFMNGNAAVSALDDGLKNVIASAYNFNTVLEILKRDDAEKALREYQAVIEKTAMAFNHLNKVAQEDEGVRRNLDYLATLGQGTAQTLIDSFAEIPLSIVELANTFDHFVGQLEKSQTRILAKPIQLSDIIAIHGDDFDNTNDKLRQNIKEFGDMQKELEDMRSRVGREGLNADELSRLGLDAGTLTHYYGANTEDEDIKHIIDLTKTRKAIGDRLIQTLEKKATMEASLAERTAIMNTESEEYAKIQEHLNGLWMEGLITTGQTLDGKNELIELYNLEYEAIGKLLELLGEDFHNGLDEFLQAIGGDDQLNKIEKLSETLGNIPDTLLQELGKAMPEIQDSIDTIISGSTEGMETAVEHVAKTIEEERSRIGMMYAAIMQDDADYYNHFRERNEAQIMDTFLTTGVMADNYQTFAEYKMALDEAAAQNALLMRDEERAATIIAAREKIAAEWNAVQELIAANGTSQESAIMSAQIRSKAQRAAAIEGAIAEQEASLMVIEASKEAARAVARSYSIFSSARRAALAELAKYEIQEKAVAATLENLKRQLDAVVDEEIDGTGIQLNRASGGSSTILSNFDFGSSMNAHMRTTGGGKLEPFKRPTSGKTPSGNKLSKGSNKDRGSSGREIRDMQVEIDHLHDTNVLLRQQEALLAKLREEEDQLYGKAKLNNLARQNALLEQKKKTLQDQLKIIEQQERQLQSSLAQQGVKFNADGTIANYNQIIQAKVNAANSLSGDAKQAAQEEVKAFMDELKKYEDFMLNVKVDKEKAIREVDNAMRAIYLQNFEFEIKVRLELAGDKRNLFDFLNSMQTEFIDLSDNHIRAVSELQTRLQTIADIEEHIKKINEDKSLTDKERIEMLEEYNKLMQEAVKSAEDLRKEIIAMNERAITEGIGLLQQELDKFTNISEEVEHIQKLLAIMGQGKNYEQLGRLYQVQEAALKGQLDAMSKTRNALRDYVSILEEGSKEWEFANRQLAKMNQEINQMVEKTLRLFQDELKNSVNEILDAFDKTLFGGLGIDDLERQWKEAKAEQDKYLSTQEKILWTGQMYQQIQEKLNETSDPTVRAQLQEFMDRELESLKEKDRLTRYDVERAEQMYKITLRQIALEEARNNRTVMRLVRDSAGNWSYQYVEDANKVARAQTELSSALAELMEKDRKALMDNQEKMLQAKKDFHDELQKILERGLRGEFATQEEFNHAVEDARRRFENQINQLSIENSELRQHLAESTLAVVLDTYARNSEGLGLLTEEQERMLTELGQNIGTNWTAISELVKALNEGNASSFLEDFVGVVGPEALQLSNLLTEVYNDISSAWNSDIIKMVSDTHFLEKSMDAVIDSLKGAWDDYLRKVDELLETHSMTYEDLIGQTRKLRGEVDKLNNSTNERVKVILEEWNSVSSLVSAYQSLDVQYKKIIQNAVEYVKQLNEIIAKQKQIANEVTGSSTPASGSGSGGSGSGSGSGGSGSGSSTRKVPTVGGRARVNTKNASAFMDSYGRQVRPWADQARAAGVGYSDALFVVNAARGYFALSRTNNTKGAIAWLRGEDLIGLRSGGYTGDWGGSQEGRLALLHEKELVLNKDDTKNILNVVEIVRDYAATIKRFVGGARVPHMSKGDIQQNIIINADFSGVKNSEEIEKAFNNLANRAAQYAHKKKK